MRECPFDGCGTSIPGDKFACLRHWKALTAEQKAEIHAAYREYTAGRLKLHDLRARQRAVIDAAQGHNLFGGEA